MLMTKEQYIESLRQMKTRVYMFGEQVENWVDHPIIRPSIECVGMTYELASDPEYADLCTAKSSYTGETVNRFLSENLITDYKPTAADLVDKTPVDGLCGKTDEDNLGFTYAALDTYIRTGACDDPETKALIDKKHEANKFKLELMPVFEYDPNN